MAKKKRRKKFKVLTLLFQTFFIVAFMACVAVAMAIYAKYGQKVLSLYADAQTVVEGSTEDDFKTSETSLVYDAKGDLLKTLKGERDTYYLDSGSIPEDVKNAFVAIEDKKFYQHNGIDVRRIAGALVANVRGGGISQGGSTITQQLVKLTYLDYTDQSYERKIKEAFISVGIEKKYSKDELLEYYINDINFANGYYGIQAAANGYFRKSASSLTLSQIAFLCAIPNSPEEFNPYTNKDNTLMRRDLILKAMLKDGYITKDQYDQAVTEEIKLKKKKKVKVNSVDSFVMDCATKSLMKVRGFDFKYSFDSDVEKDLYNSEYNEIYNQCQASLYTNGYRIYTSIDPAKQKLLQATVDEKMAPFTDTYGDEEKVYDMQATATCIDNSTGRVVAIVGGRSQKLEGYTLNRAFQSYRQPGSSIKPVIVYTPALERGYTPDTIVVDKQLKEKDAPKNSSGGYRGKMKLRNAVEASLNTVAWQVYKDVTPERGIQYLLNMHYNKIASTDYVMATAVGGFTYGTNTLEQASAYCTIANEGKYREPTCIVTITDSDGEVIVSDEQEETEIYKKNAALMMVDILKGVLIRGTAAGNALSNRMPCAGKTGTTDDMKDGWFCGFTKYYTTCVWVGCDNPKKIPNLYGATYPLSIWKPFMEEIHKDLEPLDWDAYQKKKSTKDYKKKDKDDDAVITAPKNTHDDDVDDVDVDDPIDVVDPEEPDVPEEPVVTEAPPAPENPKKDDNPSEPSDPVEQPAE